MRRVLNIFVAIIVVLSGLAFGSQNVAADTKEDIVIVIDPGHGGTDPGAKATTGAYEDECNLAIANAMKTELETYEGVKVYLTRSKDEWMTNTARAMTAVALNADFLISIHNNSGSSTNTGSCAYYSMNSYYAEATYKMSNLILDNLSEIGIYNGGAQMRQSTEYDYEDYYTIIAEGVRGGVPTCLVEHCFLSNPKDAELLTNSNGTVNMETATAMGVADATGVATYFGLEKRTATADNETTVELEYGYSVQLKTPVATDKTVKWYSVNDKVAKVTSDGVVTAVGSGTTNVSYKLSDGSSGQCTIKVLPAQPIALVGGIDPTFYDTDAKLNAINLKSAFAFVIYSDGTSQRVVPETIGNVDFNKVGVQDIPITYGELTGSIRIVHNDEEYVPEVTTPAPTEPEETTSEEETGLQEKPVDDKDKDKDKLIKILIFIIAALVIFIIGIFIYIFESKRRRNRRGSFYRRRGRRRY